MNLDVTHLAGPLWIGSHPLTLSPCCDEHDPHARRADELARAGFEVVVLCAEEWQPEIPRVETIHAPFDDDHTGLDEDQTKTAFRAARRTARRIVQGKKTLVTCWAGRNRSGLVCALALSRVSGSHPRKAADLIRAKRAGALTNTAFRAFLSSLELMRPCPLCEAKVITHRYHEDAICWIADCATCSKRGKRVPMVVYREHGVTPSPVHLKHMVEMLKLCGKPRRAGYVLDDSMLSIPDHWHAHLRPA